MSVFTFIIIQLSFLLCTLLVVSVLIIRKFKQKINASDEENRLLRKKLKQQGGSTSPGSELTTPPPLAESGVSEPAALPSVENLLHEVEEASLESVLSDMSSDLDGDANNLSQLDAMIADQSATIERIRKMREAMEVQAKSKSDKENNENLRRELKTAQLQNQQSAKAIDSLKATLDRSRIRINKVEREMTRAREATKQVPELEKANKRLEHDRAIIRKKADQAVKDQQYAIERIQQKLSRAESKNQQYAEEAAARERSLMTTIDELQSQLQQAAGSDPEVIAGLEAALSSAREELDLALREKSFIESQFIDLEQALEETSAAKAELERTKKEYEMLEQHFLEIEQSIRQQKPVVIDKISAEVAEDPEKLDLFDVEAAIAAKESVAETEPDSGQDKS